MSQSHAPGAKELLNDAQRLNELIMARSTPEERMRGLAPKERLRGLAPEELLDGLDAQQIARLREILLKRPSD